VHADDLDSLRNVRDANRLKVLEGLFRRPGSSRMEIVEQTRLSRPTVSTLLDELERAGVVEQHDDPDDARPRGAGRPPALMSLVPCAAYAVGLDVGHAHIRAAVCDLSGELLADEWSAAEVDHAPEASLELAQTMVEETLTRAGVRKDRIVGVGMALAAPIDRATGAVFAEGILPSWTDVRPAQELRDRLRLPVMLENDANLGARGERTFGAARGIDDMVYVRLSAGIGIGLVLGGVAYRGSTGIAGELGHVLADRHGRICRCGKRGCLETVASPVAVARLLAESRGEAVGTRDVLRLVAAGDRGACRAVADAGEAVGEALAMVVNVLNPQLVVVGGELGAAGPPLLDAMRAAIERHAVAPAVAAVSLTAGMLGERAEVLGAAGLALERAPGAIARRLAISTDFVEKSAPGPIGDA
jgi:predicted NBD/HSP70 family sugar kinase